MTRSSPTLRRSFTSWTSALALPSSLVSSRAISPAVLPDDTLLGCALNYNLVFPPTYARSTHKYVANLLPSYLCCFTGMVADSALAPFRERNRAKALKLLALGESPAEPDVRERLLCELEFVQSPLETEEQPALLPGSSRPSAADISLYVLVERIVGTMGDVPFAPLPELPAEEEARLGGSGSAQRSGAPNRVQGEARAEA